MPQETYRSAGVDLEAAEEAVDRIRAVVASTARPEVVGGIGGFGGFFAFDPGRYRQPLLVSTTDGVGTKSEVARLTGRYDTIGLDCVAMSVDDLAVCGAEPLFFLDYVSVGRNDPAMVEAIVSGVADGCRQAGCALVGGEISEHAGVNACRGRMSTINSDPDRAVTNDSDAARAGAIHADHPARANHTRADDVARGDDGIELRRSVQ